MDDRSADETEDQSALDEDETWLDRARAASITLLDLVERNPHGAFLTGLPVEPWQPAARTPRKAR